jgi:hypothetical protein
MMVLEHVTCLSPEERCAQYKINCHKRNKLVFQLPYKILYQYNFSNW